MVALDKGYLRERRKKVMTLDDVAIALGLKPDAVRPSLSRFERGKGDLPGDLTAEQYERVVREAEKAAKVGAAK